MPPNMFVNLPSQALAPTIYYFTPQKLIKKKIIKKKERKEKKTKSLMRLRIICRLQRKLKTLRFGWIRDFDS